MSPADARTQHPADPTAPPGAPPEPASASDRLRAERDLDALARCLPALLGSAMPVVRIPGGQSAGSPAEHVQQYLGGARRALRRLAWLRSREVGYGHVLVLLYAYVRLGPEQRVGDGWYSLVRSALLPASLRPQTPSARSASSVLGRLLVERAEAAYATAGELESDGRWLSSDLDELGRLAERNAAVRPTRPTVAKPCRADVCTDAPARPAEDVCAGERRGGRVNAGPCDARALGRRVGRSCARTRTDRWRIVAGTLVPSERSGIREPRVVRGGAGTAWALLRDAAEPKR